MSNKICTFLKKIVMKEYWKNIKDFEGLYQVSNLCRVKSIKRNTTNGGILKQAFNGRYFFVCLCKDNHKTYKLVHKLGAEAFLPNPNNYIEVNHKTEDKTNNVIWINDDGTVDFDKTTLEWCEHKYNCNYGTRNKRIKETQLNDIKKSKPILQYDLEGNFIKEWPSLGEIQRNLNIIKSNISNVCNGVYKSAYNSIWKWK